MSRLRYSDPHPENVSIPPPPGHQYTLRAGEGGGYIDCACGWSSGLTPLAIDAWKKYDEHLDSFGEWCDFCGGLWPIVKSFECRTFSVDFGAKTPAGEPQVFVYEDGWSACDVCAQLVDSGSWRELARRCVESSFVQMAKSADLLHVYRKTTVYREAVDRIVFLHEAFQKARK